MNLPMCDKAVSNELVREYQSTKREQMQSKRQIPSMAPAKLIMHGVC